VDKLILRHLDIEAYEPLFAAQKAFTAARNSETTDEIWVLQHPPVYTQGQAGKPEHLLQRTAIPVVQIDRGGQITYHGPGQIVVYLLLDLRRLGLGVRQLVREMEGAVVDLCAEYGIEAYGREDAPGVYVAGRKLASLGLRVRNGCTYHGLALNVDMDLNPFAAINPCGFQGLEVTQLRDLGVLDPFSSLAVLLADCLINRLHGQSQIELTHRPWHADLLV
jgi:lipoyl(octanoyl) transferase